MSIAIIRYNAGNNFSVISAIKRLGSEAVVTDDFDAIRCADKVLFPGVGEASSAMSYLRQTGLDELIRSLTQPVLGICIGQQLMCSYSEEGHTDCLGIFDERVVKFPSSAGMKIPHMGWNTLNVTNPEGVVPVNVDGQYVYYIHSYYVPDNPFTTAVTDYCGVRFSAAMKRDNFFATQFHPEKSGDIGEAILKRFLEL